MGHRLKLQGTTSCPKDISLILRTQTSCLKKSETSHHTQHKAISERQLIDTIMRTSSTRLHSKGPNWRWSIIRSSSLRRAPMRRSTITSGLWRTFRRAFSNFSRTVRRYCFTFLRFRRWFPITIIPAIPVPPIIVIGGRIRIIRKSKVLVLLLNAFFVFPETNDGLHKLPVSQRFSNQKGMHRLIGIPLEGKVLLTYGSRIWEWPPDKRWPRQSAKKLLGPILVVKVHVAPWHGQEPCRPGEPPNELQSTIPPLGDSRAPHIPANFPGISPPSFSSTIPRWHVVRLFLHLAQNGPKNKVQALSPGSSPKRKGVRCKKARSPRYTAWREHRAISPKGTFKM